jgi:hypothetical protein
MNAYITNFLLYGVSLLAGAFILLRTRKDLFNKFLGLLVLKPIFAPVGFLFVALIHNLVFSNIAVIAELEAMVFAFFEIAGISIISYYYSELFSKSNLPWTFLLLDTIRWVSFILVFIINYIESIDWYNPLYYWSQRFAVYQPAFISILAIIVFIFRSKSNNGIPNSETPAH